MKHGTLLGQGEAGAPIRRSSRLPALLAPLLWALAVLAPGPVHAVSVQDACPDGRLIIVLLYHRLSESETGETTVRLDNFRAQISFLSRRGYQFRALGEVVAWRKSASTPLPCRTAALTVDDDNNSTYELLLPLARSDHLPVTLFIYPSAISNASYALSWSQLRALRATGLFDVQSHTLWHPNFKSDRKHMSPEAFRSYATTQLGRSKAMLESRLGGTVDLIAWPFGIHDEQLDQLAAGQGYAAGLGIDARLVRRDDPLFGLPRVTMPDTGDAAVLARMMSRLERAAIKDGPP